MERTDPLHTRLLLISLILRNFLPHHVIFAHEKKLVEKIVFRNLAMELTVYTSQTKQTKSFLENKDSQDVSYRDFCK